MFENASLKLSIDSQLVPSSSTLVEDTNSINIITTQIFTSDRSCRTTKAISMGAVEFNYLPITYMDFD
jgi:hypothetical protein